jgi:hypothetical protein
MLRVAVPAGQRMMRFQYDSSLIVVFVDQWRLTHSFHLLVCEMAVSLEDMAMFFGLPLGLLRRGLWTSNTWRLGFLTWFANFPQNDRLH